MAKDRRTVLVSNEARLKLQQKKKDRRTVVSRYPIDRHDCKCQYMISRIKKGRKKDYYQCPRSEEQGMKKYAVICKDCKSTLAFLYATDKSLEDWCDLHYVCEHDNLKWSGCMAVNISPVDGYLGFECTCGNDTRDFRANTTLPPQQAFEVAESNLKGREFNKRDSKFLVKEVQK